MSWATASTTASAGALSLRSCDAVFARGRCRIGERILDLHLHAERLQLADDVDHLRVADVDDIFLEGQPQHGDQFRPRAGLEQAAQAFARNPSADGVVDAAARQDDFGMVAGFLARET